MQSKGAIRFVAIVLALVCLWQLAFTVVTKTMRNPPHSAKYPKQTRHSAWIPSEKKATDGISTRSLPRKSISAILTKM